ncbi:hypothetical protein AAE478_002218 [Parahypoxylon ruwenzoriense]
MSKRGGQTRREDQTVFMRPFPAAVTYDLSSSSASAGGTTTIRVPPHSTWSSGPHWHEAHTEFLQVLAGHAHVTLGGVEMRVGPLDGVVTVPRGVVHEWRRAAVGGRKRGGGEAGQGKKIGDGDDDDEGSEEEGELVVREWTEPRDGAKEVFFRNLNGLVLDAAGNNGGSWLLTLELWNLFSRADNYPVVLESPPWRACVGVVATKALMCAAVVAGWVFGCRGVYEEYSPRGK